MKARKGAVLAAGLLVSTLLVCPAYAAFTDVPESHWAAADIQYVAERGLFNGTSATTFDPNANMDRAMLATVLYRYAQTVGLSPLISNSLTISLSGIILMADKYFVCPTLSNISNTKVDLPEPLTPVITVNLFLGIFTDIDFKLCSFNLLHSMYSIYTFSLNKPLIILVVA